MNFTEFDILDAKEVIRKRKANVNTGKPTKSKRIASKGNDLNNASESGASNPEVGTVPLSASSAEAFKRWNVEDGKYIKVNLQCFSSF